MTHTEPGPSQEAPRFALGLLLGDTSEDRELFGLKLSCLLCQPSIGHGGPHPLTPLAWSGDSAQATGQLEHQNLGCPRLSI